MAEGRPWLAIAGEVSSWEGDRRKAEEGEESASAGAGEAEAEGRSCPAIAGEVSSREGVWRKGEEGEEAASAGAGEEEEGMPWLAIVGEVSSWEGVWRKAEEGEMSSWEGDWRKAEEGEEATSEVEERRRRREGRGLPLLARVHGRRFYEAARAAVEGVLQGGGVPMAVGGTGLYLAWLLCGLLATPPSCPSCPTLERAMAAKIHATVMRARQARAARGDERSIVAGGGVDEAAGGREGDAEEGVMEGQALVGDSAAAWYAEDGDWDAALAALAATGDPLTAGQLARNDWYRLTRAFEILRTAAPSSHHCLRLHHTMPRAFLNPTAPLRPHASISCLPCMPHRPAPSLVLSPPVWRASGLLEESLALLRAGLQPDCSSPTRVIGYRQAMSFLLHCQRLMDCTRVHLLNRFLPPHEELVRMVLRDFDGPTGGEGHVGGEGHADVEGRFGAKSEGGLGGVGGGGGSAGACEKLCMGGAPCRAGRSGQPSMQLTVLPCLPNVDFTGSTATSMPSLPRWRGFEPMSRRTNKAHTASKAMLLLQVCSLQRHEKPHHSLL
ncbi:unnamed protein product [Closterium sp. NIES-64]|nr:unnamed protein product [Closterium sp. NIES-64]